MANNRKIEKRLILFNIIFSDFQFRILFKVLLAQPPYSADQWIQQALVLNRTRIGFSSSPFQPASRGCRGASRSPRLCPEWRFNNILLPRIWPPKSTRVWREATIQGAPSGQLVSLVICFTPCLHEVPAHQPAEF